MNAPYYSLKKRLLLWISIPVAVAGLIIALLTFAFSWHEIEEVYDAQLVHYAKTMLQMTQDEALKDHEAVIVVGRPGEELQHNYENKTGFRIWHNDKLVMQSPITQLFDDFHAPPGFSNQTINDKPWRVFVYEVADDHLRIEASERFAVRYELTGQLMTSLLIPALLFIPIILGVVWLGTRHSLKPLSQLSHAVDTRHSDDLTPITADYIPLEIVPVVAAMNRLFIRIGDSFKREREFTDHAAHELRTPLAAMKTQTQVLIKKAAGITDYRDGLDNLHATINRSTRLVEQLLQLARLQNESLILTSVDLSRCLEDALEDVTPLLTAKNQNLKTDIAPDVMIKGHSGSLAIMLRNILDNAIKYTPAGGTVQVTLQADGVLDIADSGPGLPDNDKARVFERFVRADKSGQSGSGLGLAIARWVADAHHVKIVLHDNQPHGLKVHTQWRIV